MENIWTSENVRLGFIGVDDMLARIAQLEAALRDCIEIAGSDCEHEACKLVIERAGKLVQLEDL